MENHINKIKQSIRQYKNLIQNFSYLSILQIFNILIPFLTYPYLIRILGKETYGLVVYAQVIVSYLLILVSFGFDTYAVKEVSINRDNKGKLSEIFSSIFILKSMIFFLSLIILGTLLFFIPEAKGHHLLFWLSMWVCLNDVLFPTWFFQGMEKMKYITILTLISKSIFLAFIFILIKGPEDYLMVPLLYGVGAIISGTIASYIIFRKENLTLFIPKIETIYKYFHESIDFFISYVFAKIFVSSNKFIIGTFLGLTELAYYDLADKIIALFRMPMDIVRVSIYPIVAKTKNILIVKKTTILMSIYAVLAVIILNIFAPLIVRLLGGTDMLPCLNILRIYSIIIITSNLSNYYITVGLWSFGYIKVFRNMMIISSVLYLAIYLIFWLFNSINLYTITLTPIIIDVYLVFHIFIFWNKIKPTLGLVKSN